MITMKKKYSIIIICGIILTIIALFIILISTRKDNISFVVLEKHYSILYDKEPIIYLPIYTNQKESKYLKTDNIVRSTITNGQDIYSTTIKEISSELDTIEYNTKPYYQNNFSIILNSSSEYPIYIKNAILNIKYNTDEELAIKLGNICFSKNKNNNNIRIKEIQGIVNDIGNYESLVGLKVVIHSEYDIKIKEMKPLSASQDINYAYIRNLNDVKLTNNQDIKEILGDSYDPFTKYNGLYKDIEFEKGDCALFIPILYLEREYVDNLAILLTYTINDIEYEHIINPYKLFSSQSERYFYHEYKLSSN